MTDYAEATEEDGLIIALDQEKAYNKIAHNYPWPVIGHATSGFEEAEPLLSGRGEA